MSVSSYLAGHKKQKDDGQDPQPLLDFVEDYVPSVAFTRLYRASNFASVSA